MDTSFRTLEVNGLPPGNESVAWQMAVTEERNLLAREVHDALEHDFAGMLPQLEGQPELQDVDLPAAVVDAKMRAVAAHGRTADSLRVAVLAALNLADEVSQATSADLQLGHARANSLRMLLDEVLEEE